MLKILGMLCILAGCTFCGKNVANMYALRPLQLKMLRQGLQYLETEIVFTCTPLPRAFTLAGQKLTGSIGIVFKEIGHLLTENPLLSAKDAWMKVAQSNSAGLFLKNQDKATLEAFLNGLGQTNREEQLKQLVLVRELLNMEMERAQEESKKLVKVYSALGISVGLMLVIVLY